MSEDIRRKMRELEKQVEHHMHLYYDLDAPELEDYVTEDHTYDSSKMEAFLIPAGTTIEVYA